MLPMRTASGALDAMARCTAYLRTARGAGCAAAPRRSTRTMRPRPDNLTTALWPLSDKVMMILSIIIADVSKRTPCRASGEDWTEFVIRYDPGPG